MGRGTNNSLAWMNSDAADPVAGSYGADRLVFRRRQTKPGTCYFTGLINEEGE